MNTNAYSIDIFCDFAGTGGTFAGCAAALKQANPSTRCYLVEPTYAAALAGERVTNPYHHIQGGGYGIATLKLLERATIDGYVTVSDSEAIETARELARSEGIFAGFSTGANVAALRKLLESICAGGTAVAIASDSGLKYLSTDLWS